jgi:hypothetical protein
MLYSGDDFYGDDVTSGPADGEWREPRYWSSDGRYPIPDDGNGRMDDPGAATPAAEVGQPEEDYYPGPEDFGWAGEEALLGE